MANELLIVNGMDEIETENEIEIEIEILCEKGKERWM